MAAEKFKDMIERLYGFVDDIKRKRAYLKISNDYVKKKIDLDDLHDIDKLLDALGFEVYAPEFPIEFDHPRMLIENMKLYRTRYLPKDSSHYVVHETPEEGDGKPDDKKDDDIKYGIPEKDDANTRIKELDTRIENMPEKTDDEKKDKRCMRNYRLILLDGGAKLKNKLLVTYRDVDRYKKEEGSESFFYRLSVPIATTIFYLTYRFVSEFIPDDTYKTAIVIPLITGLGYYFYTRKKGNSSMKERES